MVEPDAQGMDVPESYRQRTNITFIKGLARTGTRTIADRFIDVLTLLKQTATKEDFVVFKYDVDDAFTADTMEWGFLADLLGDSIALSLVDEVYIELHFFNPMIAWNTYWNHNMQQHFDVVRQLRNCGIIIRDWP